MTGNENNEWNEAARRDEVAKILAFIYFEWKKPITEELISFWLENLRGIMPSEAWEAARTLVKSNTYGEPKFQDFWKAVDPDAKHKAPMRYRAEIWGNQKEQERIALIDSVVAALPGISGKRLEEFEVVHCDF